MARMKIEVQAARAKEYGLSLRDRLVGYLPLYAPLAARFPWLLNARNVVPGAAQLLEPITGFSARRKLPQWRSDIFHDCEAGPADGPEVVLFADTFNRYFERENLEAASAVLTAAGYRVLAAKAPGESARPLCCGRTFLSVGAVTRAQEEMQRTLDALSPYIARGVPVVGLEPSCILGFRDEVPGLIGSDAAKAMAQLALTFEEFLMREHAAGRLRLPLKPAKSRALLHGHCHQKSFDVFAPVQKILQLIPGLDVETIESSCCGMAGSFGYGADTVDVSVAMGEISLLPAVRKAGADDIIVADGTSCRHQIHEGSGREALHVSRVLAAHL
jgi:Fe-S oxidoreductase